MGTAIASKAIASKGAMANNFIRFALTTMLIGELLRHIYMGKKYIMKHKQLKPLYIAFEGSDFGKASQFDELAMELGCGIKIGIASFVGLGAEKVAKLKSPLFLDLKFHDIPSVVAKAVANLKELSADVVTLHCGGGEEMLRQAAAVKLRPKLAGVTVLTTSEPNLPQAYFFAQSAANAKLDAIVCAPQDAITLRRVVGEDIAIITPAIRLQKPAPSKPTQTKGEEQTRAVTPEVAAEFGSDVLVVGRPITEAKDPKAVATAILASFTKARQASKAKRAEEAKAAAAQAKEKAKEKAKAVAAQAKAREKAKAKAAAAQAKAKEKAKAAATQAKAKPTGKTAAKPTSKTAGKVAGKAASKPVRKVASKAANKPVSKPKGKAANKPKGKAKTATPKVMAKKAKKPASQKPHHRKIVSSKNSSQKPTTKKAVSGAKSKKPQKPTPKKLATKPPIGKSTKSPKSPAPKSPDKQ